MKAGKSISVYLEFPGFCCVFSIGKMDLKDCNVA